MPMIYHPKQMFSMDGYLIDNLSIGKDSLDSNWDMVGIVDGLEGSGKTTIAAQACYFVDNSITLNNVAFNPEQFKEKVDLAKPKTAILYDESYTGLSSASTLTYINRSICGMLTKVRKKKLAIFIVAPSFFDLTKYICLHRSRFLIHVYTGDNMKRGRFAFYSYDHKKTLYLLGKKTYNYRVQKPDFIGSFTSFFPFDQEEYDKLKDKYALKEEDVVDNVYRYQRNCIIKSLHDDGMTTKYITELINRYSKKKINYDVVAYAIRKMSEHQPDKLDFDFGPEKTEDSTFA